MSGPYPFSGYQDITYTFQFLQTALLTMHQYLDYHYDSDPRYQNPPNREGHRRRPSDADYDPFSQAVIDDLITHALEKPTRKKSRVEKNIGAPPKRRKRSLAMRRENALGSTSSSEALDTELDRVTVNEAVLPGMRPTSRAQGLSDILHDGQQQAVDVSSRSPAHSAAGSCIEQDTLPSCQLVSFALSEDPYKYY